MRDEHNPGSALPPTGPAPGADSADYRDGESALDEVRYEYFTTQATGRLHRARNASSVRTFCGCYVVSMNRLGPLDEIAVVDHHHLICLYCFPTKGDD